MARKDNNITLSYNKGNPPAKQFLPKTLRLTVPEPLRLQIQYDESMKENSFRISDDNVVRSLIERSNF